MVQVQKEAVQAVEQDGMVFIDEIDKIVVNHDSRYGMLWHGLITHDALLHQSSKTLLTWAVLHRVERFV